MSKKVQSKTTVSLATRLLIGIVILTVGTIFFLNFSTVLILSADKRSYVYQTQSLGASLAGRELVTRANFSLDFLRVMLGSLDLNHPNDSQTKASLKANVANQTNFVFVSIQLLNSQSHLLTPLGLEFENQSELTNLKITPGELDMGHEISGPVMTTLQSKYYAFIPKSRIGGTPLLAVAAIDPNYHFQEKRNSQSEIPIAFGVFSLKNFSEALKNQNLTIATHSGIPLFSTDSATLFASEELISDPLFQWASTSKLANGATEYDSRNSHFLGSFDRPGLDLLVLTRTAWEKAVEPIYALTEKFVLLGLMGVASGVIFALFFAKSLTAPIRRIYEATQEVAQGNFTFFVKPGRMDEIGSLTDSFNLMSRKIDELFKHKIEKLQLENEIMIASTVQQSFIPNATFKNDKISIQSYYKSASHCGGDWWGMFEAQGKLCLLIADATGHGLPAALMTASVRSCFSVIQKRAEEEPEFTLSPARMLHDAHRCVLDASRGQLMMTLFVGVFDFNKWSLTYSNAGHNPPWLFQKQSETYQLKSLVSAGCRLGENNNFKNAEEHQVKISPGDLFFMYSDGLIDQKSLDETQFGKMRTVNLIRESLKNNPETVIEKLVEAIQEHGSGRPLDDDITFASALILSSDHAQN